MELDFQFDYLNNLNILFLNGMFFISYVNFPYLAALHDYEIVSCHKQGMKVTLQSIDNYSKYSATQCEN